MSTKQAAAETPVLMTDEDFENHGEVSVYWLTSASVLINSHGTTILMDPVITPTSEDPWISEAMDDDQTGYMPLLVRSPIYAPDIHKLTAVLITHADVDHMGFLSIRALQKLGVAFHGTPYVGKALEELGVPGEQITTHLVGETFQIEDVTVEVTDALHPWQKYFPQVYDYVYQPGDCCGYKCTTNTCICRSYSCTWCIHIFNMRRIYNACTSCYSCCGSRRRSHWSVDRLICRNCCIDRRDGYFGSPVDSRCSRNARIRCSCTYGRCSCSSCGCRVCTYRSRCTNGS